SRSPDVCFHQRPQADARFRSQCQSCRRATTMESATLAPGNSRLLAAARTGLFGPSLHVRLRRRAIERTAQCGREKINLEAENPQRKVEPGSFPGFLVSRFLCKSSTG